MYSGGALGFNVGSAAFYHHIHYFGRQLQAVKALPTYHLSKDFCPGTAFFFNPGSICPGTSLTLPPHQAVPEPITFTAPLRYLLQPNNGIPNTTASAMCGRPLLFRRRHHFATFTVDADSSSCTGTGNIPIGQLAPDPGALRLLGGTVDLTSSSRKRYQLFVADYTTTSSVLTTTNSPGVANAQFRPKAHRHSPCVYC